MTVSTDERRRTQNRIAQRKFRLRRKQEDHKQREKIEQCTKEVELLKRRLAQQEDRGREVYSDTATPEPIPIPAISDGEFVRQVDFIKSGERLGVNTGKVPELRADALPSSVNQQLFEIEGNLGLDDVFCFDENEHCSQLQDAAAQPVAEEIPRSDANVSDMLVASSVPYPADFQCCEWSFAGPPDGTTYDYVHVQGLALSRDLAEKSANAFVKAAECLTRAGELHAQAAHYQNRLMAPRLCASDLRVDACDNAAESGQTSSSNAMVLLDDTNS